MVRAGCVFVAGIHPSRTWTSGSFESVRWNACVHRLDLGLYSHPKEFWGNGVWTQVNSKGKIPSTGKCPQRSIEPTTLWQRAHALPTELLRPPHCKWTRWGSQGEKGNQSNNCTAAAVAGSSSAESPQDANWVCFAPTGRNMQTTKHDCHNSTLQPFYQVENRSTML